MFQPISQFLKQNIPPLRSGWNHFVVAVYKYFVPTGLSARLWRILGSLLTASFLFFAIFDSHYAAHADNQTARNDGVVDEKSALIDSALYIRAEFFGAQALVPYPTAEARDRLAALQAKYPNDPQIDLKLSEFDEKLGRETDADVEMRAFVEHEPENLKALETSVSFFDRRAQFTDEADALERLLQVTPPKRRVEIFVRTINLAQTHS